MRPYIELILLFFLYSFFGWITEVVFSFLTRKKFVNRGFLTGPFCPIYGFGILFINSFLAPLQENFFFLFLGSTVVATVFEYLANRFLEAATGAKWWDYSRYRFNVGGYVCLAFSAFWGAGAVVIVRWVHPVLAALVGMIPPLLATVLSIVLLAVFALDVAATAGAVVRLRGQYTLTREQLAALEQAAGLPARLRERVLGHLLRRMERTVPALSRPEEFREEWLARREKARTTFAYGVGFYKLTWLFVVAALLGDIIETLYCRLTAGVWMSRSSLIYGPFSIVWGFGAVLMTILLERFQDRDDRYVFLAGMVLGGAYEYICSVLSEKLFGAVFWDYSGFRFNLGGRINLLYCIFWGIAAVVWIKIVYPFLSRRIERIPMRPGRALTWVLAVLMAANKGISALALGRYTARAAGIPAESAAAVFLDEHYPDERIERIYPNAILTD